MTKKNSGGSRLLLLDAAFRDAVPQLRSVLGNEDDFISMLAKRQPDGTVLIVLKKYGPDGGVLVSFGGGYGVVGGLLAIDGTINANRWRADKPWAAKQKQSVK